MGSGNLHNIAGAAAALVPRPSSSDADKSLHASGVKGLDAARVHIDTLAAGRAASLLAREFLARTRAPRAFSSVGESARLITVRSLVRIQKGPRPPHLTAAPKRSWGRSSAGRAPALQAGGRRFEPGRLHSLTTHGRHRDGDAP